MELPARFRINSPHVVHEPFESDIVLVHLNTGRYYCLQDSGALIWRHLIQGHSIDETAMALAGLFDTPKEHLVHSVTAFIEELAGQGLIVGDDSITPAPSADVVVRRQGPFVAPVLQTFTDMQELLLLDPIHEVDEAGWPIVRTDTN